MSRLFGGRDNTCQFKDRKALEKKIATFENCGKVFLPLKAEVYYRSMFL